MEEQLLKDILIPASSSKAFSERLAEVLSPAHSAKELIQTMVSCALEVEFGASFTKTAGFAKMVSTIADSIVTNPDLRRQALAVASVYISKKLPACRQAGKN